jgi:uncharacterized membrane protein (DUF2068 family)
VLSIVHHPVIGKFVVLGANLLIVLYLAREQLRKVRSHLHHGH